MFVLKQRFINMAVCLLSLLMFTISVLFQILLQKAPCQLCMITRYLFLVVSVVAFICVKTRFKIILPLIALFVLAFIFYHLGVENHWWNGPSGCISHLPTLDTIENIDQLNSQKSYCDQVNWLFLGISSTLWSFLFAAFIFWLSSLSYAVNYYLDKREEDGD